MFSVTVKVLSIHVLEFTFQSHQGICYFNPQLCLTYFIHIFLPRAFHQMKGGHLPSTWEHVGAW